MAIAVAALVAALAGCGSQDRSGSTTSATRAADAVGAGATTRVTIRGRAATARIRLQRVPLKVPRANGGAPFGSARTLTLPRSWTAEVWARVNAVRLEAWSPSGQLLVSSPYNGDVVELTPHSDPSAPPSTRTLISGLNNPQGLAFDTLDGRTVLYVAEANQLDRYVWTQGNVSDRAVLVRHLPDLGPPADDVHPLKDVVVGRDHTIYVDIGSSSNATPPAPTRGLPRASVLAFKPDGKLKRVWATGVRNGDGLSIAPDGTLWTAVNERDDIAYPFHHAYGGDNDAYDQVISSYVDNHPPDEVARLTAGRNLGWPFCDPDPDTRPGSSHTGFDYANMRFADDAQTNRGGRRLDCSKLTPIERGLPAHSAPLGFHFLQGSELPMPWRDGAVVAGHGSWDREPPRPPVVYWMPWSSRNRTLGTAVPIVSGFQNANGDRWGRVSDAVPGPDGALYVADDYADAVYRLVPVHGR